MDRLKRLLKTWPVRRLYLLSGLIMLLAALGVYYL